MPIPTWNVGQVLSASDVNNWFVPIVAVKVNDTSRASTVTQTADPELSVTAPGAGTWAVELYIDYEGGTSAASDLQLSLVISAGFLRFQGIYQGAGVNAAIVSNTVASGVAMHALTQGAGTLCGASGKGTFVTTGNATLAVWWAQNTTSTTATTVHAMSYLGLRRIS